MLKFSRKLCMYKTTKKHILGGGFDRFTEILEQTKIKQTNIKSYNFFFLNMSSLSKSDIRTFDQSFFFNLHNWEFGNYADRQTDTQTDTQTNIAGSKTILPRRPIL